MLRGEAKQDINEILVGCMKILQLLEVGAGG